MLLLARVDWVHYLFAVPLGLLSVFLILVILVQRGRGGGLTGALGGMGGQSAFGTKAGDLFTRITIVVAAIWILLSMAAIKVINTRATAGLNPALRGTTAPLEPGSDDKSGQSGTGGTKDAGGASKPPPASSPAKAAPAASEAEPPAGDAKNP